MLNHGSRKSSTEHFDEIGIRITFLKLLAKILKDHKKFIKFKEAKR